MMRRMLALLVAGFGLALTAAAQSAPSAEELLDAVDRNLTFSTRYAEATMAVEGPRRTKVYELRTWGRGVEEAATEFLAPARDAGTRMLKKGDELWMWIPSIEKVQKISGHMLRESLMGSDVSYEDLLESARWRQLYTAEVIGEEEVDGRPCWKLEMKAKSEDVAYPRRLVWIDKEWNIPVKQELYALSGTLLKTWEMKDPIQIAGRTYPTRWIIQDKLANRSRTVMTFKNLKFDEEVDESVFKMRWLERG